MRFQTIRRKSMTVANPRVSGILIASVFLLGSLPTLAQGIVTGSISGTVEDPSSAVIGHGNPAKHKCFLQDSEQ
jgi:hypothetical protein